MIKNSKIFLLPLLAIISSGCIMAQTSKPASHPAKFENSTATQPASKPAESGKLEIIESPIAEDCYGKRPANTVIDTVVIHHASAIYWFDPSFQGIVDESGKEYAKSIQLSAENLSQHKYDWLLVKPIFEAYHVSAHYAIARDGSVIRFVQDRDRAWHAGPSEMPVPGDDREGLNDFSIGIELMSSHPSLDKEVKTPEDAYTEEQYVALSRLMEQLCTDHPITAVVGHDEIAPGRKTDPGPLFNWSRIRNEDFKPISCE